ncbi:unnamed protein product [Choristocarpus tenellus]
MADNIGDDLGAYDLIVLGIVTSYHTVVVLTVAHLYRYRRWPPYEAKTLGLVYFSAVAGILCSLAASLRYGFWGRHTEMEMLSTDGGVFAIWLGFGLLVNTIFLRLYRTTMIFIYHRHAMYPVTLQILLLQFPFLVPNLIFLAMPDLSAYNSTSKEFEDAPEVEWAVFGFGSFVLCLSIYLLHRLGSVKVQCHTEFKEAAYTSVPPTLGVILMATLHYSLEENRTARRRLVLLGWTVVGGLSLWPPISAAVWAFVMEDEEYLNK